MLRILGLWVVGRMVVVFLLLVLPSSLVHHLHGDVVVVVRTWHHDVVWSAGTASDNARGSLKQRPKSDCKGNHNFEVLRGDF
jgi:hypothetical protein